MTSFGFEQHSSYCSLRFKPELVEMNWDQIESEAADVMKHVRESQTPAVVIDLESVAALPEGFIALLVRVWRHLHAEQRRLVVAVSHDDVRNELKRAGVDSLWTLTRSAAQAESMLDPQNSSQPAPSATAAASRSTAGSATTTSSATADAPATPESSNPTPSSATATATAVASEPIEFEDARGFCCVRFNPQLMTLGWADVEAQTTDVIEKIKQSPNNAVMVDLGAMKTINSGLVASLVRIWKTMQQSKGRFSLVSSSDMVTDVLKTAGLWNLWTVVDERDEAVYQLGAGKMAEVEQRERRVLALVAVPCAVLSLLAFIFMHASESLSAAVNAQVTSLLLAAAALATGILSVFKDTGLRRYLSIGAVVVSIGVLAATQLRTNPIRFASDYLNEVTDVGKTEGLRWQRTDRPVREDPDPADAPPDASADTPPSPTAADEADHDAEGRSNEHDADEEIRPADRTTSPVGDEVPPPAGDSDTATESEPRPAVPGDVIDGDQPLP